jgi:hypothetical protein
MAKKTLKEKIKKIVDLDAEQLPAPEADPVGHDVTLAKFKKIFKDEIKETADWLWREDKEKDFPDKKTCKEAALRMTVDNHPEYTIIDE